jgi:hypothetical protein
MNVPARYSSRYPRQGRFAILCEGDIAGYETDLLERWFALQAQHPFVDVWPCGTKTAIFGMSDAIGRAIPYLVIEDRDYRTAEQAQKECQASMTDRQERNTLVRSWRTWNRHEIENYLIEPQVVVPVLMNWFGATEIDIMDRLQRVIAGSAVDQAAQCALSMLRSSLPEAQRAVGGLPRREARPQWSQQEQAIVAPDRAIVEEKLISVIENSSRRFADAAQKVDPGGILDSFRDLADRWCKVQLQDAVWRVDWAGKEILVGLCRWLAAEFGWPVGDGHTRERINWSGIQRGIADQRDREISSMLQPDLVGSFLQFLQSTSEGDLHAEWKEIVA